MWGHNEIPLTLLPILSALEPRKARETQTALGIVHWGCPTSTGRRLGVTSEHHQSFHFHTNNPAFHGALPPPQHYSRQVKAHISTRPAVAVLWPYLLWAVPIQFCPRGWQDLSLLCCTSGDTPRTLPPSSVVITQVCYQSLLQSQLYFSE